MPPNVLSIVPARGGSKGIPRKNLRELGDRPLVAHAITTSKESHIVDKTILTTDNKEIAQIGRQYGVDQVVKRPEELASDETPLAPVIKHAFGCVDGDFEYVLCFQPTTPLVASSSIDEALRSTVDTDPDSLIFVRDSTHHYWRETGESYESLSRKRKNRQWMDPIYEEIGVFISHKDLVIEGQRVGTNPSFYEVSQQEGIDIDTYQDWILAESQLNRKLVVYRVIGDSDTGTGHVYRGITIADHLFEHDIVFATYESNDLAIDKLEESNYEYQQFKDQASFLEYVTETEPDVVVNDILDTDTDYIKHLKEIGARVVNFEDLGEGAEHADAVINALFEYSNPPENNFFGYEYFCLRNEFRYATPHDEIPSVDRIMISFGGTDENNLTAKTLRALSHIEDNLELDIVLGLGYTKWKSLDPIVEGFSSNIKVDINQDVRSMAEHMEQADLLITSNGRTLYEAGSLNLPVISIAQNQREQRHPYAHVSRGVLSLGQAHYVTEENIRTAVSDYIADQDRREKMRRALAGHDITNGIERIKSVIFGDINED
ncbi:cytidylyltransferase domain-containing protein [Halosimplex aquaticum]|uniref:Cytidylyltransferase domain-containing protein n=1 Tax=Halosimplex aquaticum TaxID=3026162 RepID=A0ABD5Y3H1_9EURY|nr:glycosyltransferase [Halosimplex aquaticum]